MKKQKAEMGNLTAKNAENTETKAESGKQENLLTAKYANKDKSRKRKTEMFYHRGTEGTEKK